MKARILLLELCFICKRMIVERFLQTREMHKTLTTNFTIQLRRLPLTMASVLVKFDLEVVSKHGML